jgi:branched-chain amino acid transport system ATP-binding protein
LRVLSIQNLSAFYGTVQALRKVSLNVDQAEIVTIIGANGAGKTTLLRTISGLIGPREGAVTFLGERVSGLSPERIVRKGISQVSEGRQIFPSMTVAENLHLGAYTRFGRDDRGSINQDLDFMCNLFPILRERYHNVAGTLSGGEQQMLAIGRALMAKPKLLLLDEPSMGLAPMVIQDIFRVLRNLNQQGLTILLVEQDVKVALSVANRGYVLQTGEIVLQDTGRNLINNSEVQAIYFGKAKGSRRPEKQR